MDGGAASVNGTVNGGGKRSTVDNLMCVLG